MFTKQWFDLLHIFTSGTSKNVKTMGATTVSYTTTSNMVEGARFTDFWNTTSSYFPSLRRHAVISVSSGGVMFGNGTAQPTIDDYTISEITGLTLPPDGTPGSNGCLQLTDSASWGRRVMTAKLAVLMSLLIWFCRRRKNGAFSESKFFEMCPVRIMSGSVRAESTGFFC